MSAPEPVAGPVRRPGPLPAPALVGSDVRLRTWRHNDAPALAAAWADEEIGRWTGVPADASVDSASRWIEGERARRARRVALDLVVAPTVGEDRVLGEVGLGPIQWDRRRAMVGYWTAAAERGRGVATGAVGLLVRWALENLPLDELVAETAPGNPASEAVLRAAEFELAVEQGDRRAWRHRRRDRSRSSGRSPGSHGGGRRAR